VRAAFAAARQLRLQPYVPPPSIGPLVERAPTPGRVTATATHPALGLTEWTLSNGARVVLKPTTFKEDEILFGAFSPGGTSLADDAGIVPA
jgi:zinc protease